MFGLAVELNVFKDFINIKDVVHLLGLEGLTMRCRKTFISEREKKPNWLIY